MDTTKNVNGASVYATAEDLENYVPIEVYNLALDRLQRVEQAIDALPQYGMVPKISRVTTTSETTNGNFSLRWSVRDIGDKDVKFHLKIGTGDFQRIFPVSLNGIYTYIGSSAPKGTNPCYIKLDAGDLSVISDVFNVAIPQDSSNQPPVISKISNIKADVNELVKINYVATDNTGKIIKHEFSDDGNTYDITSKVVKLGDKYMYAFSYSKSLTIKNAYITVYDDGGLRTKSNDFSITISEPEKITNPVPFEIVPIKYNTSTDTIEIEYKTEKPLVNVKLSLNGQDYIPAKAFTQNRAVFSVSGISNGTYNAKLRGYYKEEGAN